MTINKHIIHLSNGRLADDTPYDHVAAIVSEGIKSKNIAVHIHGGLVNHADSLNTTQIITPDYKTSDAWPVFFLGIRYFQNTDKQHR